MVRIIGHDADALVLPLLDVVAVLKQEKHIQFIRRRRVFNVARGGESSFPSARTNRGCSNKKRAKRKKGFEWEEGRQKFLHLGHSGQELVRFGLTPFAFVLRKGDKQQKIGRKPSSDGAKAKQTDRRSGRQAGVRQIE